MGSIWVMAGTFLKIFSRDRQSIFFTVFFPITFMAIFGFISTGRDSPMKVGVVDRAGNPFSAEFIDALRAKPLFEVTVGDEETFKNEIVEGKRSFVLVLPAEFRGDDQPAELTMFVDAAQARQTAMLRPLVEQTLLDIERKLRGTASLFPLTVVDVKARSQRYIDFLVPGLLAFTLMQISIAGSGYNIVEYRRKGILKRLFVTPIRPSDFIAGIVLARLVITVVQVAFLLAVAVVLLHVPVVGSLLDVSIVILLGSAIFLSLGFCMGSIAKTQQAIMLLGNLITLPQVFLSGVFFSVDSMPGALQPLARVLPLTFVVSSLREVIVNGLSLAEQIPALLGLAVWLAIGLLLAIRMFRWKEVAA